MSEMFMPPAAPPPGAPPGAPPAPGGENPLVAAMGAGPGGADTAALPPELMAALGGGAPAPEAPPGEVEPASLEAALEHFRMGVQMLQELQVASTDDQEMGELHGLMGPVQKMLADRQKTQAVAAASGPKLGGGGA
jgi:hypothetical protein